MKVSILSATAIVAVIIVGLAGLRGASDTESRVPCRRKAALPTIQRWKASSDDSKVEFFYGCDWSGWSIDEFMDALDDYIHWYNEERIKLSLGGMSPAQYRRSLGFAA